MAKPAPRTFTVSRALEKALLQHFIVQKLEIAYAISKPFPFLELLRDKAFISEQMYWDSLEACRNLVPVCRVVHNILTRLEKTFNLSLLVTLFSQISLCEYPNLRTILRSFINVGTAYGEWSRTTLIPLKVLADPEESSFQILRQLPPPQLPSPSHLSCAPAVNEAKASLQHISESLDRPPSPSTPAGPLPGLILGEGSTPVANDNVISKTKKEEDSQETCSLSTGTVQVIKDASSEPNDQEEPQEAPSTSQKKKGKKRRTCIWSTPRKNRKKHPPRGATPPGHRVQEKLQVVAKRKDKPARNSKLVSRVYNTRAKRAQMSKSEDPTRKGNKLSGGNSPQRKQFLGRKHIRGKGSEGGVRSDCFLLAEKPKENTVDFLSPMLPVICGEAKGILYKEKMKQGGASEKSIQNEKGAWLSPKEFTVEGKRERSKDWKRSVCCGGKTLRQLMEIGILLCPPIKKPQVKNTQQLNSPCLLRQPRGQSHLVTASSSRLRPRAHARFHGDINSSLK
ncbi:sp110 nuclear body protein isoform X2 [Octodon degus]|uniref:Sp110 nuclear body protein isoform X2 n=1 Tax=Octodon degus TaxID=10160 RepID=A0A6P6F064_OCTDE|nr:sp110 nuclear body protein isoform X2 [Octodon degus]